MGCKDIKDQAPCSGRRTFSLLLTAADRRFEILPRNSNNTSFDNRLTSFKDSVWEG